MADATGANHSAHRRAQIIAEQALREAAAAPTNWRAVRKRRSYTTWNTPAPTPAVSASDRPDAKK